MCRNDKTYSLTELEVHVDIEINGELVKQEMDLYAKTVIIDGLPYLGYYVIPTGDSLIEHEPLEIDMNTYMLWNTKIETIYVKEGESLIEKFRFTIFRNGKEFTVGETTDKKSAEEQLNHHITKLQSNKIVDFRKKNFTDKLINKTFNVNNIKFTVLEYVEGTNEIIVERLNNGEKGKMFAWIVNS